MESDGDFACISYAFMPENACGDVIKYATCDVLKHV